MWHLSLKIFRTERRKICQWASDELTDCDEGVVSGVIWALRPMVDSVMRLTYYPRTRRIQPDSEEGMQCGTTTSL